MVGSALVHQTLSHAQRHSHSQPQTECEEIIGDQYHESVRYHPISIESRTIAADAIQLTTKPHEYYSFID